MGSLLLLGAGGKGVAVTSVGTVWDAATVTAVTLSGGGLVATNTGTTSADQGARVATSGGKTTGKHYYEVTTTNLTAGGANRGIGIGTTAATYTALGGGPTGGVLMYPQTGNIYTSGGSFVATLSARANGNVISIAVDLDNRRIWFRVAPSGLWNNNASGNPATNVAGATVLAGTIVPFITFGGSIGGSGNIFTANFGASAFTGAVPSGFTSGWV